MVVVRLTSAGILDTSFDGDGIFMNHNAANGGASATDQVEGMTLDLDGRILVVGNATGVNTDRDMVVWRIE